ncbi:hypothetical protein CPY51_08360 [Rhizobium tubonense]|uniref:Uncharacterized protein n=1 Tax=Rhizobium tubonense TaxID=484088 RepID=A0A2W4CW52_9HYPH|nr:hypothetical protein CPY51_08360 [Rhizobium tubonense]
MFLTARASRPDVGRAVFAKSGLMPTQRSAFAFDAIQFVADAIKRVGDTARFESVVDEFFSWQQF